MPEERIGKKILLAEDDAFLSSLIQNRLEREGFSITSVANGNAVIPAIKKEHPALVLLDIILPEKLGFAILQEVKSDPVLAKTPFMIISNLAQPSDVQKAKDFGCIEYFIKSKIKIDDLVTGVVKFLAN